MKRISQYFLLIAILPLLIAFSAEPGAAAEDKGTTLKGVWKIEETEIISGSDKKTSVPQAFFLFFTEHYYSAIRDFNTSPRPLWESQPPIDKEIAASINGFMADSGTYEYDGSTLVVHHTVAMIPNLGSGGSMTIGCELKGDSLTLTPKFDKLVMPGMTKTPSGNKMPPGNMEVHYKFKRLE